MRKKTNTKTRIVNRRRAVSNGSQSGREYASAPYSKNAKTQNRPGDVSDCIQQRNGSRRKRTLKNFADKRQTDSGNQTDQKLRQLSPSLVVHQRSQSKTQRDEQQHMSHKTSQVTSLAFAQRNIPGKKVPATTSSSPRTHSWLP